MLAQQVVVLVVDDDVALLKSVELPLA